MSEWIACKDRMPPKCHYVDIFSMRFGRVSDVEYPAGTSDFEEHEFYNNNHDITYTDVTHWMESPDNPKDKLPMIDDLEVTIKRLLEGNE